MEIKDMKLEDIEARLAEIAARSRHVNLGGECRFSNHYINRMILGEDE